MPRRSAQLFTLLLGMLAGCSETVRSEPLEVSLGAQPPTSVVRHLDDDGEATFLSERELWIERGDGRLLKERSQVTFVTVKRGVVTRVVYTPMAEAGDLAGATDSFQNLFAWFPAEAREDASEWVNKVHTDKSDLPHEFTQYSTKFDLPDKVEVYVEIRPLIDSDKWYTSVHLYAKP